MPLMVVESVLTQKECKTLNLESELSGMIAAFGDFNSDKTTDFFLIGGHDGRMLKILPGVAEEDEPPILSDKRCDRWLNCAEWRCSFNDTIVSLVPGDFDGDGMMDILVVTGHSTSTSHLFSSTTITNEFRLWVVYSEFSDKTYLRCDNKMMLDSAEPLVKSEPIVFDYNGDMIADVLVVDKDNKYKLYKGSKTREWKGSYPPEFSKLTALKSDYHSSAFIDLDRKRHMSPDLFLDAQDIMYYLESYGTTAIGFGEPIHIMRNSKYSYGQSTFADIDLDGLIEHVVPVCLGDFGSNCKPDIMILKNNTVWFPTNSVFSFRNVSYVFPSPFQSILNNVWLPTTLRAGDYDGDGFVDFITVMKPRYEDKRKAVILKNVKSGKGGRGFEIVWVSDSKIEHIETAAFFDFYEDGKIDWIVSGKNAAGNVTVAAYRNCLLRQEKPSYFFKVLVTTGACFDQTTDYCPNKTIPYGTNQAGPFVCYSITMPSRKENVNDRSLIDGSELRVSCAGQLSQSAHFALQMPYTIFGLDDSLDYIDNLTASIPSGTHPKLRYRRWTEIVPNTQVVLIPRNPDVPSEWIAKLFLTPSKYIFSTQITLASLCCLLVLIIAVLHRKELLEDIAEHEEYKRHWPDSR